MTQSGHSKKRRHQEPAAASSFEAIENHQQTINRE